MSSNEFGGNSEQPYNGESSGTHVPPKLASRPNEHQKLENGTRFTSGKAGTMISIKAMPPGGEKTRIGKPLNPVAMEYKGIVAQVSANSPAAYKTSTNWRQKSTVANPPIEAEPVQSAMLPRVTSLPILDKPAPTEHQSLSAILLACEALSSKVSISHALEAARLVYQAPSIQTTVSEAAIVVPGIYQANRSIGQLHPSVGWDLALPSGPKYQGFGQSIAMRRQPQPGEICHTILIPTGKCGLIIGRGGDLITKMQKDTGCRLISCGHASENTPQGLRPVLLVGTPQTVPLAEVEIWRYINDSAYSPSLVTNGHTQYQPQQCLPTWYLQAPVEDQLFWLFNLVQQLAGFVRVQGQSQLRPVVAAIQGAIEELKLFDTPSHTSSNHSKVAESEATGKRTNQNPKSRITATDPRDLIEYEILEYLPGHYMASDKMKKLMNKLKISGQIKTEDIKELADLLQKTYVPDPGTTNLLEKLKKHTDKYYPSKGAARIINLFKIPDLYQPKKEERASYEYITRKSMGQNAQVGTEDLKLCLQASMQEKERLKEICNDLAKWIQLTQNDKDEVTRLKLCIHKLKKENHSKDSDVQLEQIRYQYSKKLEEFDDRFEEELKKRLDPTLADLKESRSNVNAFEKRVTDLSSMLRTVELEVNCLRSDKANYANNLITLLQRNTKFEEQLALADSRNRREQNEIEILRAKIASLEKGIKEAATQTEPKQQDQETLSEKNTILEGRLKYAKSLIEGNQQDRQKLEKRNAQLVADLKALKEKKHIDSCPCGGRGK